MARGGDQGHPCQGVLCSLKAKVARQSGHLEVLHSIWPDLQMLKQLGQEVQDAKL